jgi:hypothetical protein
MASILPHQSLKGIGRRMFYFDAASALPGRHQRRQKVVELRWTVSASKKGLFVSIVGVNLLDEGCFLKF